ncbi:MAG: HNH endonuclease [Myxococcales bacterium]|nr:HNH endonuclease [Myxococcales bacterium]
MNAIVEDGNGRKVHSRWLVAQERRDVYGSAATQSEKRPGLVSQWTEVHHELMSLGRRRTALERSLCQWLLAAERLDVAKHCGFSSLGEYAERHLDLTRRQTEERLRVGGTLDELPILDDAFASGALVWSKMRELSRIATGETEDEWLAFAFDHTAREVERAVSSRKVGDRPSDPGEVCRHRLVFDVSAETYALFRDLQSRVARDLGGGTVDDDTLLFEVARRALGSPQLGGREGDAEGQSASETGRAPYQVAITRCDTCRRATIDAGGDSIDVDHTMAEMFACDAQLLPPPTNVGATHPERPHVGATRATQTIPPRTRRAVLRRDRQRCAVPGCRNHRFLDLHHTQPRSEGGDHDPEYLCSLCGPHHRAAHAGRLVITGTSTNGFAFHHADGTPYGGAMLHPERAELAQQAFAALTHMGFRTREAQRLVATTQARGTPTDLATFIAEALRAS